MKVIIAGSRTIESPDVVAKAIAESGFPITEVVSGGARGVDGLGEQWAKTNHVPCKVFQAAWYVYGKKAGVIRNQKMAQYADALIAIWDGKSPGTKNMIDQAKRRAIPVHVLVPTPDTTAP